jgi:hypothetical protein
MRKPPQFLVLLFTICLLIGCNRSTEFDDGSFKPYANHDQISLINKREARPLECVQNNQSMQEWPTFQYTNPEDYWRFFAEKVLVRGASSDAWAILELDRKTIESALQIAVSRKTIEAGDIPNLREKAQRQLFKPGGRTFILMHSYPDFWALNASEPKLVSQQSGSGRLIGMSVGLGIGMRFGEIGLLIFEDRVCDNDASYAIHLELTHSKSIRDLEPGWVLGGSKESCHFVFGGERTPLPIIAALFQQAVQKANHTSANPTRVINGTQLSVADWTAIGQFAITLISFLMKLA